MLNRRTALSKLGLAALTLATASGVAAARPWPERPIRITVGFPAGNAIDTSARRIAHHMTAALGQNVIIDNRPGAAGIISHGAVKDAPPDGYSLLFGSTATLAINPVLYRKLPYDPARDFEPVAGVNISPLYLVTHPASPVNNLKDLIALAKAQPGMLQYGSGGSGTTAHIAMEMLKKAAGIDIMHVPYKGTPQMFIDLIGGHGVQFAFDAASSVLPHANEGRVKLLAVTSLERSPATPAVPTVAEQGVPGFEASVWLALVAPKGTPADIVAKLNAAVAQALKAPDVIEQMAQSGSSPMHGSPAALGAFLREETERWGQAVRDSGAQAD